MIWLGASLLFCMRRRRKVVGLTLDLTVDPPQILDEPVTSKPAKKPKPEKKPSEKKWPEANQICTTCGGPAFTSICYLCKCLSRATPETARFIREAYKGPCSLCGAVQKKYHYDHVNMFEKSATVLDLIDQPIGRIAEEIAKCQLVCLPCHENITAAEKRLGYTTKKSELTRAARAGRYISERRIALAAQYAADFSEIYAALRGG